METTKIPKKICFICEKCKYKTDNKKDFDKHLLTSKHSSQLHVNSLLTKNPKKSLNNNPTFICDNCEKIYQSRVGLWKHKKKCKYIQEHIKQHCITDELIIEMIKDNKDMKNIILEQNNTIQQLANNGVTYIHNQNCNNKSFNLNLFLNETCKDAMNISEFVDSIKVQLCDLERLGEIGYVEGISNIITDKLRTLNISDRPVHCTDKKRETIYIKDDNCWQKEDEQKTRLRKVIKKIASKNYNLIPVYREKYNGCQYADSQYSDKYNKMVIEAMGGNGENDIDKENKIIRNISKNILITPTKNSQNSNLN